MIITKDKAFYKIFFKMTSIIAIQNIIVFGVSLADNVMVGGYSEISMSGVALVNQIQFLLQMLMMAVGEGIVILSSRCWGRKNLSPIKNILTVGTWMGLLFAIVIWCTVFIFPNQTLSLFSNNVLEIAEGVKYLRIVCFSYLFFAITSVFLAALRSVETVAIGFYVSIVAFVVNIGLNYILIYKTPLGVKGAAIATLIARIIECFIVVFYLFFIDKKIKVKLSSFFHIEKKILEKYFKVTYPMMLSYASWGLAMSVQLSILGHISFEGASVVGASSIANTLFSVISVACYGGANASSVLIGKTIGEGKTDKLREYSYTLQMLYLGIGVLAAVALFFGKDFVLSFYTISSQTQDLSRSFMNVLSVTVIGTAYQVACLTGIIRGAGDTKFVLFNDLIFMWGIVIPLSLIAAFVFGLSPALVFICLKSDQIAKCFVAMFKINRFRWIEKIKI